MAKYLISFPSAAMVVPEGEFEAVGRAAHAVIDEAKAAGVYVFAGGIDEGVPPVLVSADGEVAEGGYSWARPLDGGFTVLELPSREEAVVWAARIAKACRCDQELRVFGFDPQSPHDSDLETLRRMNKRFIHNFVTNDVASHDAILHPSFRALYPGGIHIGRAAYLKSWETGFDPAVITYWDMRDQRITLVGDTALVGATNRWVRVRDGVETVGMTSYTDTYVRTADGWLCVLAQLTPVAPENYPNDDTIVVKYLGGVLQ